MSTDLLNHWIRHRWNHVNRLHCSVIVRLGCTSPATRIQRRLRQSAVGHVVAWNRRFDVCGCHIRARAITAASRRPIFDRPSRRPVPRRT
jgi:hypothetical protein